MRRPKHNTLKIMNIEDIKVGETYNVRVKVHEKLTNTIIASTLCDAVDEMYERDFHRGEASAFSPIPTKYDPCRKFKQGDRVRMVMRDGRYPKDHGRCKELIVPTDNICTVIRNEYDGLVQVKYENGYNPVVPFCFLELVTPVEELYYVEDVGNAWVVRKPEPSDMYSTQAWFSKERHPHAKEAAEAERDRLNEEHRKEQE